MYVQDKYGWLKHLDFILIDLISLILSFSISYYSKFDSNNWFEMKEWLILLCLLVLVSFAVSTLTSRFSGVLRKRLYEDIISSLKYTLYNVAVTCVIFYVFKVGVIFSREILIITYFLYYISGTIFRYIWKKIVCKNKSKELKPIYVVCETNELSDVKQILSDGLNSYNIIGNCDKDDFIEELLESHTQDVFISIDPYKISSQTYADLLSNGIRVHMNIESMLGFMPEEQAITKLGGYKTFSVGLYMFTPHQAIYISIKRVFDILCGLIGMIVLLPLALIIKTAYISNGDKKSIFYTQERVGKNGKIIRIYKFRSMVYNADEILRELLEVEKYKKEWELNQKFENDPRITPIGGFLRKTSLDEIPQLINVLKGDMSLVGPRPLVKGELEMHDGLKLYNKVKPGITGWWGCNGRSNLEYRERLELEYYYIKNCSLYLDIVCILKTVFAVLKRDGSK